MPGHLLILLGNAFILAYALDAGFSLAEEIFRHATGSQALVSWRNHLAGIVVVGSLLVVPATVLSPRLPPSVLWPLALSALWMGSGAAPLPLLLELPTLGAVLLGLQLALAAVAFLRIRTLSGGRSWLLREEARKPVFSLAYSAVALGAVVIGGIVLVLAYLPLSIVTSIQLMTDNFVRFDLGGVALSDRRYERDDQEVRLVAMMHIGERDAYQALIESFSSISTVVLAEGVTDRDQLLQVPISYDGVARALGLDTQDAIESYLDEAKEHRQRPEVRHADVDMSDFHPDTIVWLGWAGEVWDGEDPLGAIAQLYGRYTEEPERWAVFAEDVLERRNLHLLEELKVALTDYERVIVPWGALHLPFLQNQLLEMGFLPTTRTYHRLASWKTIVSALQPRLAGAEPTQARSRELDHELERAAGRRLRLGRETALGGGFCRRGQPAEDLVEVELADGQIEQVGGDEESQTLGVGLASVLEVLEVDLVPVDGEDPVGERDPALPERPCVLAVAELNDGVAEVSLFDDGPALPLRDLVDGKALKRQLAIRLPGTGQGI